MESTRISLIELVKAGDPAGWDRFIFLYRRLIEHWARNGDTACQDLEDICQEVYRVMTIRLDDFQLCERTGSFRKWLRTITAFVCQEQRRKRGGLANGKGGTEALIHLHNLSDPFPDDSDDDPDPPDLVTDMVRRAFGLVCNELSNRDRSVVELLFFEEKSPREIAGEHGWTTANVRQIKSRFLRRLRVEINGCTQISQ